MSGKRPSMTPTQRQRTAEMREAGKSIGVIARVLGLSEGAVAWHCLMAGADPPNAKPIDKTIRGPLVVSRNGHLVRRFTPEDDERLLALERQGLNPSQLARALGRKPNSIRGRLATLARHEARAGL